MGEQLLEHIRDLELRTGCGPLAAMFFAVFDDILALVDIGFAIKLTAMLHSCVLGNINGVIDQSHTIVGGFVLENITILLAVVRDKANDFHICVRDLDRVRFDMGDLVASALNLVLQIDHEQSPALGHDVIFVAVVLEWVLECSRSQSVDRVDRDFQSLC